jgi:hypothetical protein
VCIVNYGPTAGRLCVIINVIDCTCQFPPSRLLPLRSARLQDLRTSTRAAQAAPEACVCVYGVAEGAGGRAWTQALIGMKCGVRGRRARL